MRLVKKLKGRKDYLGGLAEILSKLVSCDSQNPPGDYGVITEYISQYLAANTDMRVYIQDLSIDRKNIIAVKGEPKILIAAHLDSVPAAGVWEGSPFKLREDAGKYYGLGVADVKGAIASLLYALSGASPKNFMLLLNVDEESGSNDGVKFFLSSEFRRGIELAIVSEPTQMNIVRRHNGICNFDVSIYGKQSHSCAPEEGINAIEKAGEAINKLIEYKRGLRKEECSRLMPSLNIALINGGIKYNIVPDFCQIKVSRRFTQEEDINKVKDEIKGVLCMEGANLEFKYMVNAFVSNILDEDYAMLQECGGGRERDSVLFWSEAVLFEQSGIKAVLIGPGDIKDAHKANESISKEELIKAVNFYRNLFEKL